MTRTNVTGGRENHEDFEVPHGVLSRQLVVRQDRHEPEPGKLLIRHSSLVMEVINISYFGAAAMIVSDPRGITQLPIDLMPARLLYNDIEVQELHLREVRRVTQPNGSMEIAFEVIGEPIHVERIQGLEVAAKILTAQVKKIDRFAEVPREFKTLVFEVKDWLEGLRAEISDFESKIDQVDGRSRSQLEDGFMTHVTHFLKTAFPQKHAEIGAATNDMPKEVYKLCGEFFRRQLQHLINEAPFSKRAFEKPKGYAGDFQMMIQLYRNEFIGATLFAKCLHNYFINEPAGQAVRNRAVYLRAKIAEAFKRERGRAEGLKFLSVASGPAYEVELFLGSPDADSTRKAEFVCLDQDEDSLKFAQRSIKLARRPEQVGFEFRFVNMAIKNVIGKGMPEGDFDMIYSAGLFDYLSDPVAQMAAERLLHSLRDGGRLIIGNFNLQNPTLPLMDLAWDWHLIYRSPDDLAQLFSNVGGKVSIESEGLGINLFCVIEK